MSLGPKPRDAASLILIRPGKQGLETLLGRRHKGLRFMPGIFAFPGGSIEKEDSLPSGFYEERPQTPDGLDRSTTSRLMVFLRAALRELYEETGLLLGESKLSVSPSAPSGVWCHYRNGALQPGFKQLNIVARAITPTNSPRRFHNRFLLADGKLAQGLITPNGELEDLGWYPLSKAGKLPMAEVGTRALEEAKAHYLSIEARPAARFLWHGPCHSPRLRQAPLPSAAKLL